MLPIVIPRLNDNDDFVTLLEWLVPAGSFVSAGDPLYCVETTKAAVDLQAEGAGYLHPLAEPGRELAVGAVVGHLTASRDEVVSVSPPVADVLRPSPSPVPLPVVAEASSSSPLVVPPGSAVGVTFSRKAAELIKTLGVDPALFTGRGVLREQDVRAVLARQGRGETPVPGPSSATPETLPSASAGDGRVNPAFLEQIRRFPEAFGALPSAFKVWLYRQNGALVGERVVLGVGTILDAERIEIGADTLIGERVQVRCQEFCLGVLGEIGDNTRIFCGRFLAGSTVGIRFDTVFVGAGSGRVCRIGDNSFIAYDVYVNLDRDVTLGRHVCLAPGVRLYTHRKWLSPLEGFSTGFAPVVIGDDSHLGSGVVVLPGVEIGPRVTVMANSVVAAHVGAERLMGGIPAQPVGKQTQYRRQLTLEEKVRIARKNLLICAETLVQAGVRVEEVHEIGPEGGSGGLTMTLIQGVERLVVHFQPGGMGDDLLDSAQRDGGSASSVRRLLLGFSPTLLERASSLVTVIDLGQHRIRGRRDALSDLLRQHLANLGLELAPGAWRLGRPGPFPPDRYDTDTDTASGPVSADLPAVTDAVRQTQPREKPAC
ncbi:MAG: hypothetical protein HQL64_07045 [Magnetococcales bacterium]|nr:hypothetical protein [Magnetococcales bacterium]